MSERNVNCIKCLCYKVAKFKLQNKMCAVIVHIRLHTVRPS